MNNKCYLIDCMEYMVKCKDKQFDLAIVDTPYGIGKSWKKDRFGQFYNKKDTTYKNEKIPDKKYSKELFRISKNQIIWGYNYYSHILPATNHIIIWNKMRDVKKTFMSEAELAWTNIKIPIRIFNIIWNGFEKGSETIIKTIHPHQKPILLYKKILENYAKPGQTIFDSHVGSGSVRIACHDLGFDFTGCELDKDYYEAQEKRFQNHIAQKDLFSTKEYQKLLYKE